MIHQVVYNLVENAVKFVDPDGYIQMRITDMSDRTVVAIQNSGQGIPSRRASSFSTAFTRRINPAARTRTAWAWGSTLCEPSSSCTAETSRCAGGGRILRI